MKEGGKGGERERGKEGERESDLSQVWVILW